MPLFATYSSGYNALHCREQVPKADVIIPCPLDLANPASIHSFVNTYRQHGYPLHLLINNAGAAYRREWYTDEGVAGLTQVLHSKSCAHQSSMLAFAVLSRPNSCTCTAHHILTHCAISGMQSVQFNTKLNSTWAAPLSSLS